MDALTNWSPEQLENIITFYEAHKGEYFEVMHNALKELLTRFGIPVIEDKVTGQDLATTCGHFGLSVDVDTLLPIHDEDETPGNAQQVGYEEFSRLFATWGKEDGSFHHQESERSIANRSFQEEPLRKNNDGGGRRSFQASGQALARMNSMHTGSKSMILHAPGQTNANGEPLSPAEQLRERLKAMRIGPPLSMRRRRVGSPSSKDRAGADGETSSRGGTALPPLPRKALAQSTPRGPAAPMPPKGARGQSDAPRRPIWQHTGRSALPLHGP